MDMKQYCIIGNGVAAAGCIEGIRSVGHDAHITVISREAHPVYCRPLISYYLEGKTKLENIGYRSHDFYEKNNCTVLYGQEAARIDAANRRVRLKTGEEIAYDALCVASGSIPFVPPFQGLDSVPRKYSFMTLDDTLALEEALDADAKVLIVGAGLIGLKCAEGILHRVKDITVCDLAPRILSSILDDECASIMQRHLESKGIRFLLGDSVAQFEGSKAQMQSGETVDFDILVLAVGVRAETGLVKEAGGNVGRGILTDTGMHTSLDQVYAAGDCTESHDISCGQSRILAILPNAYMQGHCAGVNMAGGSEVFDQAIPMNSIGFFGLHIMTAGSYFTPEEGGELYEERGDGTIKRLFSKDGYLTGFILVGCTERAGIYTSLIRNRTPLAEIDYEMIKQNPSLLPFGKKYRVEKLGGVV